ncbi:MAG TPA: aldehyde dehydrogenase family protein, partial [Magnetospirillaceae bacterium]|nr:aldehyde dehydrogenase family protein [Magnetospirillaceae bacterium]
MITGEMLIAGSAQRGLGAPFHALAAATGAVLQPAFGGSTPADVEAACAAAWTAFDEFRERAPEERARFLEAIAEAILALGEPLIERCMTETGLPRARLEGERGRTVNQLRMFAGLLREGGAAGLCVDPAMPDRKPLPRPDLRRRNVPLGPVAVFGASNFPLAFSVA